MHENNFTAHTQTDTSVNNNNNSNKWYEILITGVCTVDGIRTNAAI